MAGSGVPVEFFVDIDELGGLRGELQTLEAELGELPAQGMNADATAMGGGDVAGAVDRLAIFWNDGRAHHRERRPVSGLAEGAVEAYTSAENAVQNVVTPVPVSPAL